MSYRKKVAVLSPTYEQDIELRIKEAYERAGYVYKRQNVKPIVFRDVDAPAPEPITAPTPEEMRLMAPAMLAFAMEGAADLLAAADPEHKLMEAQMQVAKMLDNMRAEDPAKATEFVKFMRGMFEELGKQPPYPFR